MNLIKSENVLLLNLLVLCFATSVFGQFDYVNDAGGINLLAYEKNDFKLAYSISPLENSIQVAYSPLRFLVFKGEHFKYTDKRKGVRKNQQGFFGKSTVVSASIGTYYFFTEDFASYFKRKEKYKNEEGFLVFFNAGYSKGRVINKSSRFQTDFDYQKYFIDTGVSLRVSIASLNLSAKYSYINFLTGEIEGDIEGQAFRIRNMMQIFEEEAFFSTLEFMIQCEIGIKQVRFFVGVPLDIFSLKKPQIPYLEHRVPFVGAILELNKLAKLIGSKRI